MKINFIRIINIASLIMLLDLTDSWHPIMTFLLIGMIPGTDIILSPDQVILINSCVACLILLLVFIKPLIKTVKLIKFKKIFKKKTKKSKD